MSAILVNSALVESEIVSLDEALALAIKALEAKAETYSTAVKIITNLGPDVVPEARKDAARHNRLLAAARILRQHRAIIGS